MLIVLFKIAIFPGFCTCKHAKIPNLAQEKDELIIAAFVWLSGQRLKLKKIQQTKAVLIIFNKIPAE
jgi:hypothetical protein